MGIPGVLDVHCLHIWGIYGDKVGLSCHVVAEENADKDKILRRAYEMCSESDIDHPTIQVLSNSESEKSFPIRSFFSFRFISLRSG